MNFEPLKPGSLSSALLGFGEPIELPSSPKENDSIYSKGIHKGRALDISIKYDLMMIIISAIIFVTIISMYDVIRNIIGSYFAKKALFNPIVAHNINDINSTLIANRKTLMSSIIFASMCVIISLISVYFMINKIKSLKREKTKRLQYNHKLFR
uniref:Uncharacterized protein n=1 Tax=viral metagenome TaxID=1070528 RepID=A0A6C0LSF5_9ZZZZ